MQVEEHFVLQFMNTKTGKAIYCTGSEFVDQRAPQYRVRQNVY